MWRAFVRTPRRVAAWSRNERTLVLTLTLFTAITAAQFVGAAVAQSLSLLVDSASMLVDVFTYAANLWAECFTSTTRSPRKAALIELAVSGLSLCALWAIMIIGVAQSAVVLAQLHMLGPTHAGIDFVNGRIVLAFAIVGLVLDTAVLIQFSRGDAEAAHAQHAQLASEEGGLAAQAACSSGEQSAAHAGTQSITAGPEREDAERFRDTILHSSAASAADAGADVRLAATEPERALNGSGSGGAEPIEASARGTRVGSRCSAWLRGCACSSYRLNMSSALSHVLADLFRSSTTLVESLLILNAHIDGRLADSVAAILVAGAIALASWSTTTRWLRQARSLLLASGGAERRAGRRWPGMRREPPSPTEPLTAVAVGGAGGAAAVVAVSSSYSQLPVSSRLDAGVGAPAAGDADGCDS